MLARREHTRAEMARKLSPHAESTEQVEQLLDALVARGWLSEARFAESRANTLAPKFGSRKIEHDLRSRGVSAEVVEQAVARALSEELVNCRTVWQRNSVYSRRTRPSAAGRCAFSPGADSPPRRAAGAQAGDDD